MQPTFSSSIQPAVRVVCYSRWQNTGNGNGYGNGKNAYKSIRKQPIGSSDQNTVHLIPVYRQKLNTGKVSVREVKQWTTVEVEELHGSMECTDWDVFFSPGDSLDHIATVISDYNAFYEDMIIPKTFVKITNTKELKKTVSQKKEMRT